MKLNSKLVICICTLFLWSCSKDNNFPDEPVLEVRDFIRVSNDRAIWSIGFTDGDGDIGVRNDQDEDNFIPTIYITNQGNEVAVPNSTKYRIPVVRNIRTAKGIEGEFRFDMELDLLKLLDPVTYPSLDSVRYDAYAIDRSGNRSNVVTTPYFGINR